jgi:hypothetical protein
MTGGCREGDPANIDVAMAIDQTALNEFLKEFEESSKLASTFDEVVETEVFKNIAANLDQRVMLECLRHGVVLRRG